MQGNRAALINFYSEASILTYTGSKYVGIKGILEKIESFSFQTIEFSNLNSDVQQGPIPGSVLVFVSGFLRMDGSDEFRFSQVFNICPNGQGGLYIHNDIFSVLM
jgi:hypothetical protein